MKVRIQIIKVYDVEFPDDCTDPIVAAFAMQTTEIAASGELIDVTTDHAEIMEESDADLG